MKSQGSSLPEIGERVAIKWDVVVMNFMQPAVMGGTGRSKVMICIGNWGGFTGGVPLHLS